MDDHLHLWSYFYPVSTPLPAGLRLGNRAVDFLDPDYPSRAHQGLVERMTKPVSQDLWELLSEHEQQHLVDFWDQLNPTQRQQLESQLRAIDLPQINSLYQQATKAESITIDWSQVLPPPVIRLPDDPSSEQAAMERGIEVLQANQVAVLLVAGGQGSRLGFEKPKGLFPIGSLSGRSARSTAESNHGSCQTV